MDNKGYSKNQKMSPMEESSNYLLVCEKKDSDTQVIESIITKKGTDVFFHHLIHVKTLKCRCKIPKYQNYEI